MYHPREDNSNGVYLKWNPASFLPLPSDLTGEENLVSERINPDFHWSEEHTGEYVSLAAMLTSTRFALHCMNIANIGSHATFDADVLQLEIDLNLISEEIGKYNSFLNVLTDYANYWKQYGKIITDAVKPPVTDEVLRNLTNAASHFSNLDKPICFSDSYKKTYTDLHTTAENICKNKTTGGNAADAVTFAQNAKQFFHSALSIKQNGKLNEIVELIRRVPDVALPPLSKTTDPKCCGDLLHSLQQVSDKISTTVGEVDGNSSTWLKDMRGKINEIENWLYSSNTKKKGRTLYYYTKNGVGCVAILKIRSQNEDRCFLTFSGFADCEDPWLIKELDIQLPFYCQALSFSRICKTLSDAYHHDFTYVSYTHTIAEHIKRYEVELFYYSRTSGFYKPHYISGQSAEITLKEEIADRKFLFPRLNNKAKIANYACCERKILAYLEGKGIHPETSEAVWFIKYYPCIQCSHAIDLWRMEQKLTKLTFLYPLLDRK